MLCQHLAYADIIALFARYYGKSAVGDSNISNHSLPNRQYKTRRICYGAPQYGCYLFKTAAFAVSHRSLCQSRGYAEQHSSEKAV